MNERLKQAFIQGLGIAPDADFENLAYGSSEGWDSVAHMALIAEIEAAFDVMLPTEDVIDLSSFVRAREILEKHGIAVAA
jgi:acyl carrier protein